MRKLTDYIDLQNTYPLSSVYEARTMTPDEAEDASVMNGKITDVDPDKLKGKKAENNGSHGGFAIDEPTNDDLMRDLTPELADINKKRLAKVLGSKRDFLILGRAGWGKTSIIKQMAKKFGRTIITVYLDKAQAVDLGGIPVPVETDEADRKRTRQRVKQEILPPTWAQYIIDHPETKFLLFFDEMNQAAGDVQNALMPIVLEHVICERKLNNILIGAAGNFSSENEAVDDYMSIPLKSRFRIIKWETNNDEGWKTALNHLRNKWKGKLSDDIFDKLDETAGLFDNPRDVERYCLEFCENAREEVLEDASMTDVYDAEGCRDELDDLVEKAIDSRARAGEEDTESRYETKQAKDALDALANAMSEFIQNGNDSQKTKSSGRRRGGAGLISGETLEDIRCSLVYGYIPTPDGNNYGISLENWYKYIGNDDDTPLTAEQIEWYKKNYIETGIVKPMYKTDAEWRKKPGILDPENA